MTTLCSFTRANTTAWTKPRQIWERFGEMLDESEAALIVVGEVTVERAVEDATKRAEKEMKREVRAGAKEMEKAIDEA